MRHRIDLPEPVWRLLRDACQRQHRRPAQVIAAAFAVWLADLAPEQREALREFSRPGRRPRRRTT